LKTKAAAGLIKSRFDNTFDMDGQAFLPKLFRKPVRVTITLPHQTYLCLKKRSDEEGRSLSNLAAFLIEKSLE
jgi:hypothetical protein